MPHGLPSSTFIPSFLFLFLFDREILARLWNFTNPCKVAVQNETQNVAISVSLAMDSALHTETREDGVDITANSLHPGIINNTNIYLQNRFMTGLRNIVSPFVPRYIERFVLKNVEQGASTTCYLALHPEVSGINGKYFADNNISEACLQGWDMDLAKKLWDFSMNLTMKNEQ
ncbi:short-chain dehydrogenase TIC 32, chloroplastic-like [Vigna angularis]|uniref:short-chain dehydrogenase TIC 32, chloroplastic-like n=1 Tax=Phaseolus angularis TaxID=3914 RepID=UPI0022B4CB21|nr:short-chain dehydrogenase TIC 32, chloroplastic-like [Vigna angularis]